MNRIFLDTDVIIDFLTDRKPYSDEAAELFELSEAGKLDIHVSCLSFNNIYYIVRKLEGHKKALSLLEKLEQLTTILPVDEGVVREGILSGFKDFEDAIQYICARNAGISVIVTRNVKDFARGECAVHTPDSFLKMLARR